ncbi:hypothetical protein ACFORO_42600 [Amycolatopsis halotolerans]|uniref:Uncharacterized protein n=1 Tax=Amycolatopsis halotolerans TaxID=330083 RepID=A0ABV7QXE2_9PSEU
MLSKANDFAVGDRVRFIKENPERRGPWSSGEAGTVIGHRSSRSVMVRWDGDLGVYNHWADNLAKIAKIAKTEGEKMTHKFETTYRGVKVPEGLTNNLGTQEAAWFKRGVDAAIEARSVARSANFGWLINDRTPIQRAALFAASNPFAFAPPVSGPPAPKYHYFRTRSRSRASGQHHYWRTADGATELYSLSDKQWRAASVTVDALRAAAQIFEVASVDVPEHIRNASKATSPNTRYFRVTGGLYGFGTWYRFSGGKLEVWGDRNGWEKSSVDRPEGLKAFWPDRHVSEVQSRDVPFRILNAN